MTTAQIISTVWALTRKTVKTVPSRAEQLTSRPHLNDIDQQVGAASSAAGCRRAGCKIAINSPSVAIRSLFKRGRCAGERISRSSARRHRNDHAKRHRGRFWRSCVSARLGMPSFHQSMPACNLAHRCLAGPEGSDECQSVIQMGSAARTAKWPGKGRQGCYAVRLSNGGRDR